MTADIDTPSYAVCEVMYTATANIDNTNIMNTVTVISATGFGALGVFGADARFETVITGAGFAVGLDIGAAAIGVEIGVDTGAGRTGTGPGIGAGEAGCATIGRGGAAGVAVRGAATSITGLLSVFGCISS